MIGKSIERITQNQLKSEPNPIGTEHGSTVGSVPDPTGAACVASPEQEKQSLEKARTL